MLYVFLITAGVILALTIIFHNYRSDLFKPLLLTEHPFKIFYPAAARIADLKGRIFPLSASRTGTLMKQLYVKENVDKEIFIYQVHRISRAIFILLAVCVLGAALSINSTKDASVTSLKRPGYGKGETVYQLDVDYGGTSQALDIPVGAVKRSREEILKIFEDSYPAVINEMLGENESLTSISHDCNLISSYGDISLRWDIEDPSLLSYNGEISDKLEKDDFVPLNATVTFTIDDTSQVFSVPMVLTAKTRTEKEELLNGILGSMEKNSSAYENEVKLPESLNGHPLAFRQRGGADPKVILLFAILLPVAFLVLSRRRLEDKLKERSEQMAIDFTEIVFKLSLLYEAGLSIFRAWERIVTEYEETSAKRPDGAERYAYKEMRLTLEQIKSGAGEAESYGQFGRRCGLHQYIRLGNILEQNLTKGARGMKALLRQEAQDSFEERKRLALKKGEEASTKMLIPMVMMLIVVMVIVAVPALMSIGF